MQWAIGRSARFMKWRAASAQFVKDHKGGVFALTAIAMPAILGFSALGVDASLWYLQRRELQTVADNAAVAGTYLAVDNKSNSEITAAADEDAGKNDFTVGGSNVLTVNHPPTSGAYAGNNTYVETIVSAPADVHFIGAFMGKAATIKARAVAGAVTTGEHCIIALDPTADKALEFTGTADVVLGCGAASNSNSDQAIYLGGNASLTADPAQAFGDISIGNNATLVTKHPLQSLSQRVEDPYKDLPLPPASSCDYHNYVAKNTVTLTPGRYCGGISTNGGANVTFEPGTYIIDGGDFSTKGNTTLTGDGVTFILTADDPANTGKVDIAGGTAADLVAPSTGTYAGVLFFQDPGSPSNNEASVLGGSNMQFEGALYFPNQQVIFSGGSGVSPACLQIVARMVQFKGNGYIDNDPTRCDALNVKKVAQIRVRVVE